MVRFLLSDFTIFDLLFRYSELIKIQISGIAVRG